MPWPEDMTDYRAIVGMDPAANWLFGPAAEDFLIFGKDVTLIPFLIIFDDDKRALNGFIKALENDNEKKVVLFRFEDEVQRISVGPIHPAMATLQWFDDVIGASEGPLREFREGAKTVLISSPFTATTQVLTRDYMLPRPVPSRPLAASGETVIAPGNTVIMATIDDGIAFAHERFRNNAGTRFEYFLNLDGTGPLQLSKAQIDALLANRGPAGEDQIYAESGVIDFAAQGHKSLARHAAHGTHVLDLMAGYPPSEDVQNRPITAVQLPTLALGAIAPKEIDVSIFLAIAYLNLYRLLAGGGNPIPMVINISIGHYAGPHGGERWLEILMDNLIATYGEHLRIVMASGNGHLSRTHAEIDLSDGAVEIPWQVLPDDQTHSAIEMWLPKLKEIGEESRFKLTIVTPDDTKTVLEELDGAQLIHDRHLTVVGTVTVHDLYHPRDHIYLTIEPTRRLMPDPRPRSPAGQWQLIFEPLNAGMDKPILAWIQWDETIFGFRRVGRQSYFDHPEYDRFDASGFILEDDPACSDCPVKRRSHVNGIATGADVITVGGFVETNRKLETPAPVTNRIPARYSAGGPTNPPEAAKRKPDALLASEGTLVHRGVLAAGPRSGAVVAVGGSSVAAPQLSRHLGNWLATGQSSDRHAVRLAAIPASHDYPAERKGWGVFERIDPPAARYFTR